MRVVGMGKVEAFQLYKMVWDHEIEEEMEFFVRKYFE